MVSDAGQGGEALGAAAARLQSDVASALRRKPAREPQLAGALRALAPHSPAIRETLDTVLDTLIRRGSYDRPLYEAAIRSLGECDGQAVAPHLGRALASENAGGLCTLSAACFVKDPSIADNVARVAASRHPQLAFAAEVARVARGESDGRHLSSIAPKIKESHRISLCVEVFVPLTRAEPLPEHVAPALSVLRGAERHLGRWLVFAEVAKRAGDREPLERARERAKDGPASARAAWAMVAWALGGDEPPDVRPTVELVARLSDRPSADRDTTFLYRLADARFEGARPMLESLAKGKLNDEASVRAALYLARDHGRGDLLDALRRLAGAKRRGALRGVAAAALYDAGDREAATAVCDELLHSRQLPAVCWGGLLKAAERAPSVAPVVAESSYRRVQLGWLE